MWDSLHATNYTEMNNLEMNNPTMIVHEYLTSVFLKSGSGEKEREEKEEKEDKNLEIAFRLLKGKPRSVVSPRRDSPGCPWVIWLS